MGMGPRMREDTDYEWGAFLLRGLIILLCVRGDGRFATGLGMGPRMREHGLRMGGVSPIYWG